MAGTMALDGQQVLAYCGGFDTVNFKSSGDCFALRVGSTGEVAVDSLAQLPESRSVACYGSGDGRCAVAGGRDAVSEEQ